MKVMGKDLRDYASDYLKDIAMMGKVPQAQGIAGTTSRLLSLFTRVAALKSMGLNPKTALIQYTSLAEASSQLGSRNTALGYVDKYREFS